MVLGALLAYFNCRVKVFPDTPTSFRTYFVAVVSARTSQSTSRRSCTIPNFHVGKIAPELKKKKPEKDNEPLMIPRNGTCQAEQLGFFKMAMCTRRNSRAHVGHIAGAIQLKRRMATERGTPRDVGCCDHEDLRVYECCELRLRETEKLSHFVKDTTLYRSQVSLRL